MEGPILSVPDAHSLTTKYPHHQISARVERSEIPPASGPACDIACDLNVAHGCRYTGRSAHNRDFPMRHQVKHVPPMNVIRLTRAMDMRNRT